METIKIRKLKTPDFYRVSRILKTMGLKLDANGKTQMQMGTEMILALFENVHMAAEPIDDFFASLISVTAEEYKEMDAEITLDIIMQIKDTPMIANFFKRAEKLTK